MPADQKTKMHSTRSGNQSNLMAQSQLEPSLFTHSTRARDKDVSRKLPQNAGSTHKFGRPKNSGPNKQKLLTQELQAMVAHSGRSVPLASLCRNLAFFLQNKKRRSSSHAAGVPSEWIPGRTNLLQIRHSHASVSGRQRSLEQCSFAEVVFKTNCENEKCVIYGSGQWMPFSFKFNKLPCGGPNGQFPSLIYAFWFASNRNK